MLNVLFSDATRQHVQTYFASPQAGELMGQIAADDPRWAEFVTSLPEWARHGLPPVQQPA